MPGFLLDNMVRKFYKYAGVYWSLVIISVYVYIYFEEHRQSERYKAIVTYNNSISGGGGKLRYSKLAPYFEFRYKDSVYEGYDHNRSVPNFDVGDTIKIYIKNGKPETASIYTFLSFWLLRPEILWPLFIAAVIFLAPLVVRQFIRDMKDVYNGRGNNS